MKIRITALAIILCIVLLQFPVFAAVAWPAASSHGRDLPFRPTDGYVSMQNPPNFTWQYVKSAVSYELCVYTDEACSKKKYSITGLAHNYYNFDYTFETGKNYWWRVRYYLEDGSNSEWSTKRRFRIDPDAYEFTVPPTDELVSRIPAGHPRVITTKADLEEFRNRDNKGVYANKYYTYIVNRANNHYNKYINGTLDLSKPQRPDTDDPDILYAFDRNITGNYTKNAGYAYECGYAYLLSGDERYAEVAKAILKSMSTWGFVKNSKGEWEYDTTDVTSYKNNDTIHRVITYKSAMVYDWIYDTMTEEEKAPIRHMIRERGKILSNHLVDGASNAIRKMPYDSHGWTAFGFLGITAYAMYGEFPEAEYWFRNVIPAYAAIFPPWSYQDGGWSQGTDYWKDSTIHGQEFLDVMALSGVINYYKSAWGSQEYLWSLYTFPAGSYGAFGDDSNLRLPNTASADSVSNTAYFTNNSVAKWILETLGGEYANTINTYYINTDHIYPEAPTQYPLSHEFEDIGWVVMTSDLMDTDRVQAYFKSSYYGSFNHSHADQNSFVIQAFGEKLAVKSGYYDSYHSVHDKTITRATFAHNSVTYDGGKGQPSQSDDFTAKGDINQFVTQMDFDSATGDATPAYKGEIGKYIRNFIYIRPGTFVVVDDLEAKKDTTSTFEWWLNAEDTTITDYDDNSALIESGEANLITNVVYPKNTRATFYDGFINPLDGLYYEPNASRDFDGWTHHDRVSFSTDKVASTRMVVTMSAYKDNETADVPKTEYASNGSYVKLTFKDGTVCIVNLGSTSSYVTCGDVKFKGRAVTYNDYSIMLTDGTYLQKGVSQLVLADNDLTCALGYGQISLSLEKDTHIDFENAGEYLKLRGSSALTDHKGRPADSAVGVSVDYSLADYGYVGMDVEKGNHILLTENSAAAPAGFVPDVFVKRVSGGNYEISWVEEEETVYDILINGNVYENVSSPYTIIPEEDTKTYNVAVRVSRGAFVSDWSDFVYISPDGSEYFSAIRYSETEEGIKAEVFANNPKNENYTFVAVVYSSDGAISEMVPLTKTSGNMFGATIGKPVDGSTIKTYLWTEKGISPKAALAHYNSNNLSLVGIALDGVMMENYSDDKDEYDVFLPYGTDVYPRVSPKVKDNSTKMNVVHDYSKQATTIELTAQNGEMREVTLNYILEEVDKHRITGASTEDDFKNDTGRTLDANGNRSGKVSKSNVAELTCDFLMADGVTVKPYSVFLPVYTNLAGNGGGDFLGSRLTSDRAPASMTQNHTEFSNPNKSYLGYDHIVMPNNPYFVPNGAYAGGSVRNAKLKFSLEENAEILVLSTARIPSLEKSGFALDVMEKTSNGRYMNSPGYEDKYYNIMYNGIPESAFTDRVVANYDILNKIINVKPIEGLSTWSDYENNAPGKSEFVIDNGIFEVTNTYLFKNAYVKRYDDISGSREVEIDFGDYTSGATRSIVIVRPLTPQKPISDFRVTAPSKFEELPPELLEGSDDNLETHLTHNLYSAGTILRTGKKGSSIFAESTKDNELSYINDMLGIEGACFIPMQNSVNNTTEENNWMRAYYYGIGTSGSNVYPAMEGKTNDFYEFTLTQPADIYVVTTQKKPLFIDDTWQKLNVPGSVVIGNGMTEIYNQVYLKHIDATPGEPAVVSMKTAGTGKVRCDYLTFIKFKD